MKPFANKKGASGTQQEQDYQLAGSDMATMMPMSVMEQLIQLSPLHNRMAIATTMAQVLKHHNIQEVSPKLCELITTYTTPVGTDFEWIYPRRRNAFSSFKRVKSSQPTQSDIPGYYLG